MSYTVTELVRALRELPREFSDRSVVVGGRWGVAQLNLPGESLGMAVELDLEDIGLDDQGRASISSLAGYLGEQPEYRNLSASDRATVIGMLLPPDREDALTLATAAIEHRPPK